LTYLATQISVGKRDDNTSYITFYCSDSTNPNSKETKVVDIKTEQLDNLVKTIQKYQGK